MKNFLFIQILCLYSRLEHLQRDLHLMTYLLEYSADTNFTEEKKNKTVHQSENINAIMPNSIRY